ncbi:MAG: hydroxylamine reductase [Candidatus Omnitrophica bacterium]|nr:hydroxylamine reductase [Candidatus Omnitrophota bacterium]
MVCRQCEQTANNTGCTLSGVCGKIPYVSLLQDLLIHSLKGIAIYGNLARQLGATDPETDRFLVESLFATVTNVNFDPSSIAEFIRKSYQVKQKMKTIFLDAYKKKNGVDFAGDLPNVAGWKPADTLNGLKEQEKEAELKHEIHANEDIQSLREILLYGLKGMAAYADHAWILGEQSEEVNAFFHKGLASLTNNNLSADDLLKLIMEFGQANLKCLEVLDAAHNKHFGNPVPTKVSLSILKGPAIIVSGHDLRDLEQLLIQTTGKNVNIYTHGEMLPAHGYPGLKKYKHLVGHFGGAWQNQQKEFDNIPAAILMTTNCIQKPRDSYKGKIFTTGLVGWPEVKHIIAVNDKKDFSEVINKAKELGGWHQEKPGKEILVGFGHVTVLSLAGKIIEAVKSKAIRHFFLVGGCDGAKPGRNYYTEFASKLPADCIILTLACGKFRFNTLEYKPIGDFPRLLDCGQCNDSYSAIVVAGALAKAFGVSVNDLPLSLILSWYEQKAVCILLTLLSLGIKNIRLGPSLPAFISPGVLKVLVDKFAIKPVTTPEQDLKEILG